MANTKEEKAQADADLLAYLEAHPGWYTADQLRSSVTVRRFGSVEVGARLRSLKSRGLVRSRLHAEGFYNEWRAAS